MQNFNPFVLKLLSVLNRVSNKEGIHGSHEIFAILVTEKSNIRQKVNVWCPKGLVSNLFLTDKVNS